MNKKISKLVTGFNSKLYLILMLTLLIPTIYKTLRIYYLGELPADDGFNIASQVIWLQVVFEMVQESLILPLFFLLGKSINHQKLLDNKIKTGIITTLTIYFILVLIIFLNIDTLLVFLAQKDSIIKLSSKYIQLESISILLGVIYRFTMIVLILLNKYKELLLLLIIQTGLTCIFDIFFISQFTVSLRFGVLGIAYVNIVVNGLLIFASIYLLVKQRIILFKTTNLDFSWLKEWFKIGSFSGLESIIRNTIFIIVVLRWVNMVEGQSHFWLSITFFWSWLLIPVIALGELIKKEVAEYHLNVQKVIKSSLVITTLIVIVWLFSIPFWEQFFNYFMNIDNPEIVFRITIMSLLFYIVFAYNNIIDSIFYGLGRTDLMFIQSIVINLVYYGVIYVLVLIDQIHISLDTIVFIFGIGMFLDSILTFGIYKYTLKNHKLIKNISRNVHY